MTSTELQFDKMDVNTELAKNYFKTNNYTFRCLRPSEKSDIDFTVAGCKIYGVEYVGYVLSHGPDPTVLLRRGGRYIDLSNKLYENIDLICQLEYLIRQKPIQTTKLELDMVIKKLRHQIIPEENPGVSKTILMSNDSPLINLGCISMAQTIEIVAMEKTAILCYLIYNMLDEFDRNNSVMLTFVKEVGNLTCSFIKSKVLSAGCIGAVTAQSDVDSAVAKLLSAPQGDIWGMRRILVQESAIDRFKKAIAWKCRGRSDIDTELKSRCSDLYVYDDKMYLYEYVGDQSDKDVVIIEAFRTVKELISLLECYSPFCLSLWSSDVAESNEIALGVTAPLVWVNDYGVATEPAQSSQVYYSHISAERNPKLDSVYRQVCKIQKDWAKLTMVQRRNKVKNVLETLPARDRKAIFNLCLMTESNSKNFAHVTTNSVVLGITKPRSIYTVRWRAEDAFVKDFVDRLIDGSGFLIYFPKTESETDMSTDMKIVTFLSSNTDLPIRVIDFEGHFDTIPLEYTTRVVYTSFGTIFAN